MGEDTIPAIPGANAAPVTVGDDAVGVSSGRPSR